MSATLAPGTFGENERFSKVERLTRTTMRAMQVAYCPLLEVACVIGAAVLWSTTGTSQDLAGGTLSSLWFGGLRLAFATCFFVVFAAATGGLPRRASNSNTMTLAYGASSSCVFPIDKRWISVSELAHLQPFDVV